MIEKEITTTKLDMVCICREEGQERSAKTHAKVSKHIGSTTESNRFVTDVVAALSYQYDYFIKNIGYDQWFGVTAQRNFFDGSIENYRVDKIRVECDRVEDGLAAILEYCIDNKERIE